MAMNTPENFWSKVAIAGPDDCWPWLGATNNTGYGTVWCGGVCYTAHRVAAYLSGVVTHPSAPKDRTGDGFILHQCDNRLCCNQKHMKVGTYGANQKEAYARGRRAPARGCAHANSKLTPEQVVAIRKRYAGGESQVRLGALYGVTQPCIGGIVRRETYKDIE